MNFSMAVSIVVWMRGRRYDGKVGVIWLLAFTLPIPTMIYLFVVYKFTDQLRK